MHNDSVTLHLFHPRLRWIMLIGFRPSYDLLNRQAKLLGKCIVSFIMSRLLP
jgi:hypothetical protein